MLAMETEDTIKFRFCTPQKVDKWDLRFMRMAREVSGWSKDPSTRVGCYVVRDRLPLVHGYNGFPKQIEDTPEMLADREIKMKWMIHAEANAIYNATELGISLKDSTFYVSGLPCCEACALALIRVGARRVVAMEQNLPRRWIDSCMRGVDKLVQAKVQIETLPMEALKQSDLLESLTKVQ